MLLQDTLPGAPQAGRAIGISQLSPSPLLGALQASFGPAPSSQRLQLLPGPGFVGAVRRCLQHCPCLQALPPDCLISWRALHHDHVCPVLQCRHSVTAVPADQDGPVLAVRASSDGHASRSGLACACSAGAWRQLCCQAGPSGEPLQQIKEHVQCCFCAVMAVLPEQAASHGNAPLCAEPAAQACKPFHSDIPNAGFKLPLTSSVVRHHDPLCRPVQCLMPAHALSLTANTSQDLSRPPP